MSVICTVCRLVPGTGCRTGRQEVAIGDVETCIGSIDIVIGILSPRCFFFSYPFSSLLQFLFSRGVDSTEKFSRRRIKISWRAVMI